MILGFNKLLACSLDETMDIDDSLIDAHNLLDRLEGEFNHNTHLRDMDALMSAAMSEAGDVSPKVRTGDRHSHRTDGSGPHDVRTPEQ